MKNRLTGVVLGQLIGLIVVCIGSACMALVSFGGIAGAVIGSAPKASLEFFAPYACPNGSVNYEEYTATYNRPGETNFYIECVASDGTTDITLQTIGLSLLGIYLSCFLPLCIPGGLIAIAAPLLFLRNSNKTDNPSAIS